MVAQHKYLPDGSCIGKGWILEQNLGKARFMMKKQEAWKKQQ